MEVHVPMLISLQIIGLPLHGLHLSRVSTISYMVLSLREKSGKKQLCEDFDGGTLPFSPPIP